MNQVEVEYGTDWGPVDYALLESPDGEPAIAVEAKALWKNLEATAVNGGGMLGHWGVDVQGKGPH